jgi:hypothetical protein
MNALTRTIVLLLVATNLVVAGTLQAQNASNEQVQDAFAARKEAEVAAKVAQKQAEAAQKQVQVAQQQMEFERTQALVAALAAQEAATAPPAPVLPTPPSVSVGGLWMSRSGAASVLVIPTAEIKTEDVVAMTEDMSVMSRIFETNLEQAHIATSRGGLFVSSRDPFSMLLGGGAIQSMYLEGYGALFLVKVDFPLSPPPQVVEEPETKKEQEGDSVWEQTRRQMYEPQEVAVRRADQPEQKYDAEKVENLKTTLVKSLKHAANIRCLKPDESVILTIAGSGESAGNTTMITTRREIEVNRRTTGVRLPVAVGTGMPSQIMLVIRAKKSDIDSFAKGDVDYEQFRQRTGVFTCPCLGTEAGCGDSLNTYFYGARR